MSVNLVEVERLDLGLYAIEQEIGRGNHGAVFRGHVRSNPDQRVAIKVITNKGNLDRLRIEPDILKKLNHPNIVRLYDSLIVDDHLVLIMELLDGVNLETLLEQSGPLQAKEVRNMLRQLGDSLVHSHDRGVVHCDIKPSNILVVGSGQGRRYVLTDFGVSRMTGGVQTRPRIAGTHLYMAPEQIRGRAVPQSDLWALSAVAVTALTGEPPFHGASLAGLIRAITYDSPPLLESVAGLELSRLLGSLLEKPLASRVASAKDLCEGLNRIDKLKEEHLPPVQSFEAPNITVDTYWEAKLVAAIKKQWTLFWIGAVLFALPTGVIASGIQLVGALLIWQWCMSRAEGRSSVPGWKRLLWIPGLVAIIVGGWLDLMWLEFLYRALDLKESDWAGVNITITLLSLPGALLACFAFGQMRLLKRQLSVRRSLQRADQGKSVVETLKELVTMYPGETSLYLRLTEAFLYCRLPAEAVVEAQLVLEDDPYNFDATLHLAQGYYSLGLMEQCVQVCNGYLAISPISFEFEGLRERVAVLQKSTPATETIGEEVTI